MMITPAWTRFQYLFTSFMFCILLVSQSLADGRQWHVTVGERTELPQHMFQEADRGYFTDGAVPVIQVDNLFYAFWANYRNYRTRAASPFLEDHLDHLDPQQPVFGGRQVNNGESNGFNDGGMWLIGVQPLGVEGRLAGFFHAESHWYPRSTMGWYAYKSVGIAYSDDNGLTWGPPRQILKLQDDKPAKPAWSGLGDGCVIYNHLNNKFYCYYTPVKDGARICMAATADPTGYAGWKKWYRGSFSEPGMNGMETPVSGLGNNPGANPSVHWNTYLERFVMLWHGWDGRLYIAVSSDGESWEEPRLLLRDGKKAWYPVIVGKTSTWGGQTVSLYYSADFNNNGQRKLYSRTLTFQKNDK